MTPQDFASRAPPKSRQTHLLSGRTCQAGFTLSTNVRQVSHTVNRAACQQGVEHQHRRMEGGTAGGIKGSSLAAITKSRIIRRFKARLGVVLFGDGPTSRSSLAPTQVDRDIM